MIASGPPPNRLLQVLDAADFDRPYLITIELVREAVLGEAGRDTSTFRTMCRLHAGMHGNRHQATGAAAVTNEPIAKISRREHDGTYPCRE